MLRARVGRILFEADPADPDRAFMIEPDGLTGWDDGTAVRRESAARPGRHGSFSGPATRDSRVVSITGWVLASSPTSLMRMCRDLSGILADGESERMVVEQSGETTWAEVELTDLPTVRVRGASELEANFQIQFWAADPRRYGAENTYPSGFVHHFGNFPAIPVVEVTGAMGAGYAIHGPEGRRFVVTQPLLSGQTHRIDMRTGRLYRDGVLQIGAVSNGGTWTIPPAKAVPMTLVPVVGGGVMTVKVLDTFI